MLGGNYSESNFNFGRDCRRHVVLCPRGSSLQRQHRTGLRTWRAAPRQSGASRKEPAGGTPDARGGMGRAQFRSAKDYHHRDEPQADAEELVESGAPAAAEELVGRFQLGLVSGPPAPGALGLERMAWTAKASVTGPACEARKLALRRQP